MGSLARSLRLERWTEVELVLPADVPESLQVELPGPSGPATLVLELHSNRAEGYRLVVVGEDGVPVDLPPPPVSTYRGHILGEPDWHVAATLLPSGLKVCARRDDGAAWFVEPLRALDRGASREQHLVYEQADLDLGPDFCGAELLALAPGGFGAASSSAGGGCFREANIAFDADHENYLLNGSDAVATSLNVEASLNAVNDMYAREVAISHNLTQVLVRTAEPDPYPSFDPGTLLDSFRNHWNTQQGGVVRDMAHLATGKEMDGNIIGLAWVGVVCNQPWAYGLTQYNLSFGGVVSVLAHELGHNWNAPHCLDAACVIMCGGCLEFGPITTQVVLDYRDNAGCLSVTGGYAAPVPPKVRDESLEAEGPVVIDVLANDFDGNCDALHIQGFDGTSAAGAAIELSSGTGPNGRDELRYLPAPDFEGVDSFGYEVGDGTGLASPGLVEVRLYDGVADLALHLALDETSGSVAFDASGHGNHVDLVTPIGLGLPGATPQTGTSIEFNGAFSRGVLPGLAPLDGLREELSLALWVRPDVVGGERWIFGAPGSWHLGLSGADLVFHSGAQDFVLSPGPPSGTWSHVALVFDAGHDVTFFLDGIALATVPGNQPASEPLGEWLLGGKGAGLELFDGRLDDLQLYDHELELADVFWLYQHPGQVFVDCEPITSECATAPNSVGSGATISASGSPSLGANDLGLIAVSCPPNTIGLFYYGSNAVAIPFGDGLRCVDGDIKRLTPLQTDVLGFAVQALDLTAPPFDAGSGEAVLGERKHFQFWYRDVPAGGAGFNLSDALVVRFCL